MNKNIEEQIKETDCDAIREMFKNAPLKPHDYQCAVYRLIGERIRRYSGPSVISASVSSGKSFMIAMNIYRLTQMGVQSIVLSRQAEIIEQDADEIKGLGVPCSIYCAGVVKARKLFNCVVGSEGTVVGGLFSVMKDFVPQVMHIDEGHMVNWIDIWEAEQNKEDYGQMVAAGRGQYTIIIRTLQKRCRDKFGFELRIFCWTGSPYRGTESIINTDPRFPQFWTEQLCDISSDYLVKLGAVVPTVFGETGINYDLHSFVSSGEDGVSEFSEKQLTAMQREIMRQGTLTQKIMLRVQELTATRNAVLITCAGKLHCREVVQYLPAGSYAIIDEKTPAKERRKILKEVYAGKIKYTVQIMALTTGVNQPLWDTLVILRKIGSLTLLTQLIGRGMRKLKQWHIDHGYVKNENMVLDFAGTMDELGQLYFSPMLENYLYSVDKKAGKTKECPKCMAENSFRARRCIGEDEDGNRCDYFFTSIICENVEDDQGRLISEGCGAENDPVAKVCRCCGNQLKDPNKTLTNKPYTDNDWFIVKSFKVTLSHNQRSIVFNYALVDGKDGHEFNAYEFFNVESSEKFIRDEWRLKGLMHVMDSTKRREISGIKNAVKIMSYAKEFKAPLRVTHRRTQGAKDYIYRKDFIGEDITEF